MFFELLPTDLLRVLVQDLPTLTLPFLLFVVLLLPIVLLSLLLEYGFATLTPLLEPLMFLLLYIVVLLRLGHAPP